MKCHCKFTIVISVNRSQVFCGRTTLCSDPVFVLVMASGLSRVFFCLLTSS